MGRVVAVAAVAALITGAAWSAAPEPIETRTQALLELQAAIEDEQRALELLRKSPPRIDSASARIRSSMERLQGVNGFLSRTPGADKVEQALNRASDADAVAEQGHLWDYRYNQSIKAVKKAIKALESALGIKRNAQTEVRRAQPSPAVAQCSDGKDNDGDGIADWTDEPGCTSSRDVRESSPLTCVIGSTIASSRLVLSGSCTGAFSELEVTLLDGVTLNGGYDIAHAPSCGPPTPTGFRCSTKNGAQNPGHRVDLKLTTTSPDRRQRVSLRFYNRKKRLVHRVVVPPPR
jgi:hypothetical protein